MSDYDHSQVMLILGEIKGELKGITAQVSKIDSIDERLRKVETKAAINGGITGTVAAIGVALITESVKAALGSGRGGA